MYAVPSTKIAPKLFSCKLLITCECVQCMLLFIQIKLSEAPKTLVLKARLKPIFSYLQQKCVQHLQRKTCENNPHYLKETTRPTTILSYLILSQVHYIAFYMEIYLRACLYGQFLIMLPIWVRSVSVRSGKVILNVTRMSPLVPLCW